MEPVSVKPEVLGVTVSASVPHFTTPLASVSIESQLGNPERTNWVSEERRLALIPPAKVEVPT